MKIFSSTPCSESPEPPLNCTTRRKQHATEVTSLKEWMKRRLFEKEKEAKEESNRRRHEEREAKKQQTADEVIYA